jgi:arylsulfatase A-like enzyme
MVHFFIYFLFSTSLLIAQNHPNVIVILADDLGWGDLSSSGNNNLKTPNIDSIATSGAKFNSFYVCAVCAPTRAEFLTGRFYGNTGVRGVSNGLERLNLDETTIADIFKKAGYQTAAIGKWHNGNQYPYHPNGRGFDEFYGMTSGHWGEYFDAPLQQNGKLIQSKGYITNALTDHAIQYIEKTQKSPFFLYLPYNVPHTPYLVPDSYWNRFKDHPLPQRARPEYTEELNATRCSLAMVENLDDNIGRILSTLKKLNLEQNTIVIFFSDNGPNTYRWNGNMKGKKSNVDEGGLRSPCFISWPSKISPNQSITQLSGAIDLLPTLASLCKIKPRFKKPLDGIDLSPQLLETQSSEVKRHIFSHWTGKSSLRTNQYRIHSTGELYDIINDPSQNHDISKEHPDITSQLQTTLTQITKQQFQDTPDIKTLPSKNKKTNTYSDLRPYIVGFSQFPTAILTADEATFSGSIKRSAKAPNCSYLVNWTNPDDIISWEIEVMTPGQYEVELWHTCSEKNKGCSLVLEYTPAPTPNPNQNQIKDWPSSFSALTTISESWDPPLNNEPYRVPPSAESTMKPFKSISMGKITLSKTTGTLRLKAKSNHTPGFIDFRMISIRLKS